MQNESDKMRRINDALEYFRREIYELYETRPELENKDECIMWTAEVITLQTRWIKTLENKIHLMRKEGAL